MPQVDERSLIPLEIFEKHGNLSDAEKHIEHTNNNKFNIDKVDLDTCLYSKLISSHELSMPEIQQMHAKMEKLDRNRNDNFEPSTCSTTDGYNRHRLIFVVVSLTLYCTIAICYAKEYIAQSVMGASTTARTME